VPATPAAQPTAPVAQPASTLAGDLVVYSARKEELMQPVVDAFKRAYPNVKVTVKSGAAGELSLLVRQEKSSPRGDVFFTTDAPGLESLRQESLLESYRSPNATSVPDEFKAADGGWTGVIGRSRNFMINTQALKVEDAPQSILELTDPKWADKVAIASIREGGVRSWLSWLMVERGEEWTKDYVDRLRANGIRVLANHSEVANSVARGEVPIGLLNHYYYVPRIKEGAPVALIYPDQAPDQTGTLVIPLAVGVVKGAPHPDTARAFVDFLLSADGQEPLTTQEQEFPLVPGMGLGAAAAPGVRSIDQIKRPKLDWTELAKAEKRAVELFTPVFGG
jgi:iron(III) transport system substrate-binding protein